MSAPSPTSAPPETRLRPLVRDETTEALYRAARDSAERLSPVSAHRALRDSPGGPGYVEALWRTCVELGWTAIPFTEARGGLGLGMWELAAVQEALGRTLSATPLLSSIVLSGVALARGGNTLLADAWLPALISGERRLAFAHDERHPARTATRAHHGHHGWILHGAKTAVIDGLGADAYVVGASTDSGAGLFLIGAHATGLRVDPQRRIDGRNAATLHLDGVVSLGEVAAPGSVLLGEVLDLGRVALAAELLGLATATFEHTLSYLKTRQQFGVPIGSFQALQHRAARMFMALELARSAVLAAAAAATDAPDLLPRYAVLAKARANDAAQRVTEEAIQMHGGIGMTDECDIGFFLKRARVAMETGGTSAWCRARWATLNGY